jgi:Fic family protein
MKQPFIPNNLPLEKIDYLTILPKIVEANKKITEYNTFIQTCIPNADVLLSTLNANEAVLSSRIEGTQATLEEVVEFSENLEESNKKFADIQEVQNYRKALHFAIERIKNLPLSLPLLKEIHEKLLDGVRGQNKDRGNFRKTQNWI